MMSDMQSDNVALAQVRYKLKQVKCIDYDYLFVDFDAKNIMKDSNNL